MKINLLCDNKWIQLREMVDAECGVKGYVFSHEIRCNGIIVSILPFRKVKNQIEFLLRDEVTPCWGMAPVHSSITGGVEKISVLQTAVNELKEEAGYVIKMSDLISLGTCRGIKSSDSIYFLYTVDLTNKQQEEAKGDGSELEKKAYCFWTSAIDSAQDPFVYVTYYRLTKFLKK